MRMYIHGIGKMLALPNAAALIEPISSAWAQIAPNAFAASPLKLVNA